MSTAPVSPLEEIIRESGEGWLIDRFEPKDRALNHLRTTLAQVNQRAQTLLGVDAPNLSEDAIVAEYRRNPQKVRAFLQALGGTRTPDMLLMAWRILQGMEIAAIEISYQRQEQFRMQVVLRSPYGENDTTYASSDINDFALLRQIGFHEISGHPVFDGFYALKVRQNRP